MIAQSAVTERASIRQTGVAMSTEQGGTKIQRACGPQGIGASSSCIAVMGEVVGERFDFVVNCDEFRSGEGARLGMFARTIESGERIEIHGFSSLDGDPVFNQHLSCARAIAAEALVLDALSARGITASVSVFMHGATSGRKVSEQRSAIITRSGVSPKPTPPPDPSCDIDVRATHIGGALSIAPIWHLFVVHTDNKPPRPYPRFFRGGPGGSCAGRSAGKHGTIITAAGYYAPGTVDWDPSAPSKTVMTGLSACAKLSCLKSEVGRIDSTCTRYDPLGPNSNTVASTILSNCGITRDKPVSITPGWNDPNI